MPQTCTECCSPIGFFRRKNRCGLCRDLYCETCFAQGRKVTRSNLETSQSRSCLKCMVLSGQRFNREDLSLLNVKHLRDFLIARRISTRDCTEKYHLIDLVMKFAEDCGQRSVTDLRQEEERRREVENLRKEAERRAQEEMRWAASQSNDDLSCGSKRQNNHLNVDHAKKWKSVEELTSSDEIRTLTVAELKRILIVNFVDFRGCCEKAELVERVRRLWEAQHKLTRKVSESKDDESSIYDKDLCKICMDAAIDCVLLDCGHLVTCVKCGKRLAECPICRQLVCRVVHVFRA